MRNGVSPSGHLLKTSAIKRVETSVTAMGNNAVNTSMGSHSIIRLENEPLSAKPKIMNGYPQSRMVLADNSLANDYGLSKVGLTPDGSSLK